MKNRHDGCPSDEELQRVVDFQADPDVIERVEDHIGHCSFCIERLAHTDFSDSKLLRIHRPSQASPDSGDLPVDVRDALVRSISATPFSWPTAIGPYRVIRKIGQGAMGEVFECHDDRLNRRVAVKSIIQRMITDESLKRISEEARLQAGLQHPNIVSLYDLGMTTDGTPFLVMELVAGTTLKERIKAAKLSPKAAAELIRTCALAVHYAHEHGVVHRDLKPSNILLASEPEAVSDGTSEMRFEPKIADFGLAKSIEDESHLVLSGSLVGTPAYMAPEQIHAGAALGPSSDVYALGAILYECLTGQLPFRSESLIGIIRKIQESEPLEPSALDRSISQDLERICLKCLSKHPADRYLSAHTLAEDLGRFLEGRSVLARPVPWFVRSTRWIQRNPGLAASATVSVLSLVALAIGGVRFGLIQSRLRSAADAAADQARKNEIRATQATQVAESATSRAEAGQKFAFEILHDSSNVIYTVFLNLQNKESLDKMQLSQLREELESGFLGIADKTRAEFDLLKLKPETAIDLIYRAGVMQWEQGNKTQAVERFRDIVRISERLPQEIVTQPDTASQIVSAGTMIAWKSAEDNDLESADKQLGEIWDRWIGKGDPWFAEHRQVAIMLRQLCRMRMDILRKIGRSDQAESYLVEFNKLARFVK